MFLYLESQETQNLFFDKLKYLNPNFQTDKFL